MRASSILLVLTVLAVGSYATAVTCTAPADADTGCYQCDSSAPSRCSACKSGYYYNGMANSLAGACMVLPMTVVCPKPAG